MILNRINTFLWSRGLFKNWFWVGVEYMLIRHGLIRGDVDVVFRCRVKARLNSSAYSWLANAYRDGVISLSSCYDDTIYLPELWVWG